MRINYNQAARTVGKEAVTHLDANAGEGYITRLAKGAKEFTDGMFGGNEAYDRVTNFLPTKAKSTTETLHLDTDQGISQLTKYQEQVIKQKDHVAEQLKKFDPAETGNSSEYTQKMYDRYAAQGKAYEEERLRIEKGLLDKGKFDINVGASSSSKVKNLGDNIKNYYTEGDAATLATRAGVTAGVYGAGAIGLRYASGGNLGTNANGESDIAGIPFI